jgi:hypothetical protein
VDCDNYVAGLVCDTVEGSGGEDDKFSLAMKRLFWPGSGAAQHERHRYPCLLMISETVINLSQCFAAISNLLIPSHEIAALRSQ